MKDIIKIAKGYVTLTLSLIGFEEGEYFIVHSPALDISAFGCNEQDAFDEFKKVLELYVESVFDEGTFAEDLKRHGWNKSAYFKSRYILPEMELEQLIRDKNIQNYKNLSVKDAQIPIHA